MKHTKGPWIVGAQDYGGSFHIDGINTLKDAATRFPDDKENRFAIARKINCANAALIAAAPEMLEALEAIVESKALVGKEHVDIATKMIKAIVKARGES